MLLWWWWLEKCRGLGIWRSPFGASPALPPTGKHISCVITRSLCGNRPVLWHWALAQMLGSVPMPTSLFQQARAKLTFFLSPKEQINLLPTSKISLPCFSFAWLEFFLYSVTTQSFAGDRCCECFLPVHSLTFHHGILAVLASLRVQRTKEDPLAPRRSPKSYTVLSHWVLSDSLWPCEL